MSRSDRLFGILLQLSDGAIVPAMRLAERFEVSTRTIQRDIDALGAVGVPVFARRGHGGGYQLTDDFLLPPIMLSEGEAISLVLGLSLFRSLRSQPLANDLDTARRKLLAAVPKRTRDVLADTARIVGFEMLPPHAFRLQPRPLDAEDTQADGTFERRALDVFLSAVLSRSTVELLYQSPRRASPPRYVTRAAGLLWDRSFWYLIGQLEDQESGIRTWRADRVLEVRVVPATDRGPLPFDVRDYLDRAWLASAMSNWSQMHPVRVRMTLEQAQRLQRDWYYQHATFEVDGVEHVVMSFGQSEREIVFAMLRWLGPGVELLEPSAWRTVFQHDLFAMADIYSPEASSGIGCESRAISEW